MEIKKEKGRWMVYEEVAHFYPEGTPESIMKDLMSHQKTHERLFVRECREYAMYPGEQDSKWYGIFGYRPATEKEIEEHQKKLVAEQRKQEKDKGLEEKRGKKAAEEALKLVEKYLPEKVK